MKSIKDDASKDSKKFDWDSVGLDFGNWDDERLWALELPIKEISIHELIWHFDVPFWPNDNAEKWTVTPWDVIHEHEGAGLEQKRLEDADLAYPIDILRNHEKWLVLDGLHRLAKAYKQGQNKVKVRIVPQKDLPKILLNEPVELPEK